MTKAPTLADQLYRATFSKHLGNFWAPRERVRDGVVSARKFVLDTKMSSFLADLASAAFITGEKKSEQRKMTTSAMRTIYNKIEQMRTSARAPHRRTWVEYNLRAEITRVNELRLEEGLPVNINPKDAPQWEAWLIEQHPTIETAFCCSLFSFNDPDDPDEKGFDTWIMPLSYVWSTDDRPPPMDDHTPGFFHVVPFKMYNIYASEILTGITGYHTDKVACGMCPYVNPEEALKIKSEKLLSLFVEWTGVIRRMWAFLATINDIPVTVNQVVPVKGFVGRGRYHRFLEHKTITLTVPDTRDVRKIARQAIAVARRRAHQVRGHWRKDYRHPGERLWIREHQRGDATIGFVTHDYAVEKGDL